MDEDAEFYRWYGPWATFTPPQAAELLAGIPVRWWIFGGWSIDAFTGQSRVHEDIDIAFLRSDLPAVLEHLLPTHCVWSNAGGTLRPLRTPQELLDGCRQLWIRQDGASPWLFDVGLNPHEGDTWICARHNTVRLPMSEVVYEQGGISYQRPEITLLLKAWRNEPKDRADLHATVPLLAPDRLAWLRTTLEQIHPGHPWLANLPTSTQES
ncbi:hypothetical protein Rhe02_19020 [Rhizocola hellebori]|uniref:Amino acid transporter n=1 Tax=Rhizocola hellebori TaxID=1392758 RepID=A0A8J3VES6_9ACTN|nr:hypothetical protein [Rhizocola hellebori]GIH03835.1 hypothetical protein Rhe02_19020 [Rhizocola hellebori]